MMSHLPVRLALYQPDGTLIGQLPDAFDVQVSCKLNDASTLKFSYPRGGLHSDWLIPVQANRSLGEVAVLIGTPGASNGTGWWEPKVGRFLIDSGTHDFAKDGSADIVSMSLTGIASRLSDAVVLPDSSAANVEANSGNRVFTGRRVGAVVRTLINEAVARGWGKDLDLSGVSGSFDVLGAAWPTIDISISGGTTLRKLLDDLVARGLLDWRFSGRRLELYNQYDWTQTGPAGMRRDKTDIMLPLIKGEHTKASDSFDWSERAANIIIEGEHSQTWQYGTGTSNTPGTLPYNLGQRYRELYVKSQGLEYQGQADVLAQQYIVQGNTRVDELKRTYSVEVLSGQPLYSFLPGDYLTVARTWTAAYGSTEEARVDALSLTWSDYACTADITLGRMRDSLIGRLSRMAAGTDNGVRVASVSGSPSPGLKLTKDPTAAAPGTVSVTTMLTELGVPYAIATIAQVTRDRNGNNFPDGEVRYEVQFREASTNAGWVNLGTSPARTAELTGLKNNTTYQLRARAVFYSADRLTRVSGPWAEPPASDWSATYTFTTGRDSTPPPIPSKPSVECEFRAAQITWDGLAANGLSGEPADFSHLNVALVPTGTTLRTTHTIDRGMGYNLAVASLAEGDFDVAFQAVDINGNVSAWGGRTTFTCSALVDAEAIQRSVDAALAPYEATVGEAVALANAASIIAQDAILEGETPPASGRVDISYWEGPDGQWWILREAPST